MVMANRTIREFSAPSAANVATGPDVIIDGSYHPTLTVNKTYRNARI
jgi:hypothetical protein